MKSRLDPMPVKANPRGRLAEIWQIDIAMLHWIGIKRHAIWVAVAALCERTYGFARQMLHRAVYSYRRKDMAIPQEQFDIPDEGDVHQHGGERFLEIRPNAIYQDLLDAPEHLKAELINGTLRGFLGRVFAAGQ